MQLSEHFSLEELIFTQHRGIDNTPPEQMYQRLVHVLAPGLEQVRAILGGLPIHINSGYRCHALNQAVGGSKTSAHVQAYAADLICPQFGPPHAVAAKLAAELKLFDQIILEFGDWTHVSFDPMGRHQLLTKRAGHPYETGLIF